MARTKEFDPQLALERAMHTFWARGFEATSTKDLVSALGISRSSLYGTFTSKEELYLRALALYAEQSGLAGLAGEGPLKPRLRRALQRIVDDNVDQEASRGCFAGNAAAERSASDATRKLVVTSFDAVREVLVGEFARARGRGELSAQADVEDLADFLLVMIEGLHVVTKGTRDRRLAESAIETALHGL